MASAGDSRKALEAIVAIASSAVMFYFGNGLEPWWPLMWFAPLPVLLVALRSRWWTTALVAISSMLLGCLNLWSYFNHTLKMPAALWFEIFGMASVLFAVAILLFRALVLRGMVWSGLVAVPSLMVAADYLRNVTSPHGTAGSLAYSQLGFLPFLQLASITGPWGMTFVLLLLPSALAIAWYLRAASPRKAMQIAATALGVTALAVLFGAVRLAMPQGETARVGLIASDAKEHAGGTVSDPGAETERLFADFARVAADLTRQGAQAIVMPEKMGVTLEGRTAATDAALRSVAEKADVTIVAGVVHVDTAARYNEARVYVPGAKMQWYDKEHMLPPFESDLKPGTELTLLPRSSAAPWGVAICKDMDFSNPSRRYAREGVGLMLVPAWDFVVDRSWHGHIAIMRGVEGGFSIARSAKKGYLTVSDSRGRIIGERPSDAAEFATLLVDVPAAHHWTVYQVMGDWFAWVAIAMLLLVMIRLATGRTKAIR